MAGEGQQAGFKAGLTPGKAGPLVSAVHEVIQEVPRLQERCWAGVGSRGRPGKKPADRDKNFQSVE